MLNLRLILLTCFFLCFTFKQGSAQYNNDNPGTTKSAAFQWPEGKKMAIRLTFDDARLTQVDTGIPLMYKYKVKSTFYVSPQNMIERIDKWKKAIQSDHEIGNHSVFHPCTGNFPWTKPHALENYTLSAKEHELDSASKLIENTLGIIPVSFGYPCGQTIVGRGAGTHSYVPLVSVMFETGRRWLDEGPNDPKFCDMAQLTGMPLVGKSFNEIKGLICSCQGKWLILAGYETDINSTLLCTLEEICKYASDPKNNIWIDNVHNIETYIKTRRKEAALSSMLP